MARVRTDADALGLGDELQDPAQMLETIPQARSLAGGRFEVQGDVCAAGPAQHLIQSGGDAGQACVFPLAYVSAWVGHQIIDAQSLTAPQALSRTRRRGRR